MYQRGPEQNLPVEACSLQLSQKPAAVGSLWPSLLLPAAAGCIGIISQQQAATQRPRAAAAVEAATPLSLPPRGRDRGSGSARPQTPRAAGTTVGRVAPRRSARAGCGGTVLAGGGTGWQGYRLGGVPAGGGTVLAGVPTY
jgi:hypothetical protein